MKASLLYYFLIISPLLFSDKVFAQAPNISYTTPQNYATGTAITPLSPSNSGGAVLSTFGYGSATSLTPGTGGWNQPKGIAINASDNVYITNLGQFYIYKYDNNGSLLASIATSGIAVTGIVVTSTGDLYALRKATGAIYKISGDVFSSTVITTISGATGNNNMAIDASNNIYITTSTGVSKYNIAGNTTTTPISGGTHINGPSGVAVDATGNIYVLNFTGGTLEKFNSAGTWQSTIVSGLSSPYGLVMDGSGNFYVSQTGSSIISSYTSSGATLLSNISYLAYGLALDSRGVLYASTGSVGTSANRYAPNGGYYINNTLPAGLSFDNTTGIISGTPTASSSSTAYKITGYNSSGSSSATVNISSATLAPSITYTPSTEVFQLNQIVNYTPVNTGSPVQTNGYSISPALSNGLSFSTATGAITGTLTSTFAATNYMVTATNSAGHSTVTINLSCVSMAPSLSYSPSSYNYPVNIAITALNPTNTGGVVSTWTITPVTTPLPAGLSFSTSTGTISGTPTAITSAANFIVKGTNSQGSSSATVTIAIVPNPPVISYATPQSYLVGTAISTLSPTNTGGASTNWSVSPALPAGLSISVTTGAITGTPSASSAATNYTVTATDATGHTGTAVVNITSYQPFTWLGSTSTNWNTKSNWAGNAVPGSGDQAVFNSNYSNAPTISSPTSVGSIVFGTPGGSIPNTVTVNSTLTVSGDITYQSDGQSSRNATVTFTGTGTISANNLNVIANTTIGAFSYIMPVTISVSNLTLNGNLYLTSAKPNGTQNSSFTFTGSTLTVGNINTSNTAGSTSTISISPSGTLNLTGSATFAGLSATGTNTLTVSCSNIAYSGNKNQIIYTNAAILYTNPSLSINYTNLTFGGSGIKTPEPTGVINVSGNFTNTLANDATDYVDFSGNTVNFNGTAQALAGGTGTGTTFYKVSFSGAGTKTMSGLFNVASTGILSMSGTSSTILNAGTGALTLNSDANGSASVTALNGPVITGTVNVQRYITGDSDGLTTYRGYRLLSSAVNNGAGTYSLAYLKGTPYPGTGTGSFTTGSTGTNGGFDGPGNPTIYLYREDKVPNNSSFTAGNYRAVTAINTLATIDSSATLYTGNGFLYFYRGNNSQNVVSPSSLVFTSTGALNQGTIQVNDWYTTPATHVLGYTGTGTDPDTTNYSVRGFNLVGNPYPSTIDWETFSSSNSAAPIYGPNVDSTIYCIDPISHNYSTYLQGVGGTNNGSQYIASGQGFFVHANTTGAALTFNESAKVSNQLSAGSTLLLNAATPTVNQHLRLKLLQDSVNTDESYLGFRQNASTGYVVNEDALYLPGNGEVSLSSMSADNRAMAINVQPFPKQRQVIPLNINVSNYGVHQLSLTEAVNIPAMYDIWLLDAYTKDSLDIKHNPTYSFNITSDAGTYNHSRFSLVIRPNPALAVHLLSFAGVKETDDVKLSWTVENEANYTHYTLQRSTDGGKSFSTIDTLTSASLGAYTDLDQKPVKGLNEYRLKQVDVMGNITYSSIVTVMYSPQSNNVAANLISVYPNPVGSTLNLAITQPANAQAAAYAITITNSVGVMVKTSTSAQPNWQGDVSGLPPGTYFIQVINTKNNTLAGRSTFIKL